MTGSRANLGSVCLWVLAAALAGAGCGDDEGRGGDAGTGGDAGIATDGGGDTGTSADAGTSDGGGVGDCVPSRLLITTSDFVTGGLGTLDLATGAVATASGDAPDQDSAPGLSGCTPVVLQRGLGSIRLLDTSDPLTGGRTVDVNPVGASGPYAANPQKALEIADDELWVVLGAVPSIAVVDPTAGGGGEVVDRIDLSGLVRPGDMDGNIDASDAIRVGDRVYVALGNYWFDTDFAIHFEGSALAVLDATTRALVDVDPATDGVQLIELAGDNPWRGLWHDAATNTLVVGASGDSFALDGQLEVVDLETHASVGSVTTETMLGAEINGFGFASPNRLVVLAGSQVLAFDPTVDFGVPELLLDGADGMLLVDGVVWTWARMGDGAGLRAVDPDDGSDVTPGGGPIAVGTLPVNGAVASP